MVISAGRVKLGALLSFTVMVWIWSAAALPQPSTRCQGRVMIFSPAQAPFASASVKVACSPLLQLSVSSVTYTVAATLASQVHLALVKIVISAGRVKLGALLSFTELVWIWSAAALPQPST